MPVVVMALAAATIAGAGAAYAAPSRWAGTAHGSWIPGAVRFASSTNAALAAARAAAAQVAAAERAAPGTGKRAVGDRRGGRRVGARKGGPAALIRRAAITGGPVVTDAAAERSKRGLPAPAMSQAMLRANQVMQAAAARQLAASHPPAARDLRGTQRSQLRDYWCGPAMVTEMLAQMKVTLRQPAAARALGTNLSGTDWSNGRGYPVPRVLNAHEHRHGYVAVALPWSPTRKQIAVFRTDLISDIVHGAPLGGNAYEVPGGPHLIGHPPGQTIMHWFDIRGYSRGGAFTDYEDSVHGASSIGWSAAVPRYSTLPTVTVAVILGARGYVW